MSEPAERLNVSAFARLAGCNEKQVRRALERGVLSKGDDGLLDAALARTPWRKTTKAAAAEVSELSEPNSDTGPTVRMSEPVVAARDGETLEDAAARLAADSNASTPDAIRRKENYLGLLKQLEYDQKSGAVVAVADVAKLVGEEYAKVRTRLLSIPSERAPQVHRLKTVAEVEDALRAFITEALEELTQDGASA